MAPGCGSAGPASTDSQQGILQAAEEFLTAIRAGDSAAANARLTPLAQQRMREADMDFSLLESQTSRFELGQVERFEESEASVETVWIEADEQGQLQRENWTLALERVENSWRILGILAETGPDQPPMVMDFENPGQAATASSTASTSPSAVPQQATRPTEQDPFRQ
jgi:hypothetical protein